MTLSLNDRASLERMIANWNLNIIAILNGNRALHIGLNILEDHFYRDQVVLWVNLTIVCITLLLAFAVGLLLSILDQDYFAWILP